MVETTKLSVGKALDKLRGTDVPAAKLARFDEKIEALNKETQQLRAMRLSVEHSQRVTTGHEAPKPDTARTTKRRTTIIMIGLAIGVSILLGTYWLFWH